MKFGEKIKKIRETFYLSQEQFSVISNIPLESIIEYEEKSIDPDFENLGRLEDLLEVDRKILMNDEADITVYSMNLRKDIAIDYIINDAYKDREWYYLKKAPLGIVSSVLILIYIYIYISVFFIF